MVGSYSECHLTELKECEPYWARILSTPGKILLVLLTFALTGGCAFLLLEPLHLAWRIPISVLIGSPSLLLLIGQIRDRFLPSFEVRDSGSFAGNRTIAIFGIGVLLAGLVGVVVNRIS